MGKCAETRNFGTFAKLGHPTAQFDMLESINDEVKFSNLTAKFSDLRKLITVFAYVMRVALKKSRIGIKAKCK